MDSRPEKISPSFGLSGNKLSIYREARHIGFKLGQLLDECGQARREVEVFLNQNLGRTDQATGIKAGVTDYFDQLHILDRDMRKAASIRKGGN